jgi:hypothetical protein
MLCDYILTFSCTYIFYLIQNQLNQNDYLNQGFEIKQEEENKQLKTQIHNTW